MAGFNFSFGGSGIPSVSSGTTPPFVSNDGTVNWLNFLVSQENLAANTFLANQAVTSPRASSVSILPGGGIQAAGGGAGVVGASNSLFNSPVIWLLGFVLLLILIFRR